MDFELTEQQEALKASIQEVVGTVYPPERARKDDEEKNFPQDIYMTVAKYGWIGLPFPKEYGGGGGNMLDACIVEEELSRIATGLGIIYCLSTCFGGETLQYSGTEEQKQHYLTRLCSGEYKFALSLTEPGGGTDILGSTRTTAVKDGDEFIINGSKTYITGAQMADYLVTFVRTSKVAKKAGGFSLLLVPAKTPGVQVKRLDTLGFRVAGTCEVFYDNVRVPASNLLGEREKGWYYLTHTLNRERVILSASCVGIAQAVLDIAVQCCKETIVDGKPLGQSQGIQQYLGDLSTEIDAARLLTYRAAWLLTQGIPCIVEAAKADVYTSEVAVKAGDIGVKIVGNSRGPIAEDMRRLYRDSLPFRIGPISNQMIRVLISQMQLGLGTT